MTTTDSSKPILYIDIDGVLLANEKHLADGAVEFIKYIAENFEVYWLTTHCMHGDGNWAVEYVNRAENEDLSPWLCKFKPTTWSLKKTEAIDFSKPFIWYDDDLFTAERMELDQYNAVDSWHEIDLQRYPDTMLKELEYLQTL